MTTELEKQIKDFKETAYSGKYESHPGRFDGFTVTKAYEEGLLIIQQLEAKIVESYMEGFADGEKESE